MVFSFSLKRIALIVGFIIAVGVAGYLIYRIFFSQIIGPGRDGNTNINGAPSEGLPTPGEAANTNADRAGQTGQDVGSGTPFVPTVSSIARGGLTSTNVLTTSAFGKIAPTSSGMRYYDPESGKFYEVDDSGFSRALNDGIFPEVTNLDWSPSGSEVIMKFPDGRHVYFNFDTKDQVTLPRQFDEPEFSTTGKEIAFEYHGRNPEDDSFIGYGKPDGSEIQPVELLGYEAPDVDVSWSPKGDVIATFRDSLNATDQEIFLIGKKGENLKSFRVEGRGFEGEWSPQGDRIMYSVYNPSGRYAPELWMTDVGGAQTGANNVGTGLNTWIDKCTFASNSSAYCGVPTRIERGAGLYPSLNDDIPDNIYHVDLNTGVSSLVAAPVNGDGEQVYTVDTMRLSQDGKTLYFTDKTTGELRSIRLE